jgi:hypothetical protein
MSIKHLLLAGVALLVLAGCEFNPISIEVASENGRNSRIIAEVDGCRIWEVYNSDGHNPFFARCPEGAATSYEQYQGGNKNQQTFREQTLGDVN